MKSTLKSLFLKKVIALTQKSKLSWCKSLNYRASGEAIYNAELTSAENVNVCFWLNPNLNCLSVVLHFPGEPQEALTIVSTEVSILHQIIIQKLHGKTMRDIKGTGCVKGFLSDVSKQFPELA